MQNYLQNVQNGGLQSGKNPTIMPTTRKNPKKPILNSLNTSSDYHPAPQILSPNASNYAVLSTKGVNNVSSSAVRSLVN